MTNPADYFTHLRAIRSSADRLALLRSARAAYTRAMAAYLSQLDREIATTEAALIAAHTDRVPGNDPCQPHAMRRFQRMSN